MSCYALLHYTVWNYDILYNTMLYFEGVCLELPSSWPQARVFRGLCTTPRVAFPLDPEDPGDPVACPFFSILGVQIGTCALGWFEKSKNTLRIAHFRSHFFISAIKIDSCAPVGRETTEKHNVVFIFLWKTMKIVVLSFKISPAARPPVSPAFRPSRAGAGRTYIHKLPIDR